MGHSWFRPRRLAVVTAAWLCGALSGCGGGEPLPCTGDLCVKAQDLGSFLAVEQADETAGGNDVLSEGGPLGGGGKMSVSLRATRIERDLPAFYSAGSTPSNSTDFPTRRAFATSVTADVAIGVSRGGANGISHTGALDILASITHHPKFGDSGTPIAAGATSGGLGLRLGLLEETRNVPGVSVTVSHRWFPMVDANGINGVTAEIKMSGNRWRVAASKQLGHFGVTAGAGQDSYHGLDTYAADGGSSATEFSLTRTNAFVGGSVRLRGVTIAGELGRLSGHVSPGATTTFGGMSPDLARTFLTLGLRTGQ